MNLKLPIFLSILILLFGCQGSTKKSSAKTGASMTLTESTDTRSVLTGRILDESTKVVYLLINKYSREKVSIDSNQFATTLDHNYPQIIELSPELNISYPVFIAPGDSVHLEFYENDLLNDFSKISFSGDHAKENSLLLELRKVLNYDNPNHKKFFNCSEEKFLFKIDSIQNIANGILKRFKAQKITKKNDFELLAQSFIDFKIANYLEKYPDIMKYTFWEGEIELSKSYMDKKKSYPLNQPYHLNNISFLNYISGVVYFNASKKFMHQKNHKKTGRSYVDLTTFFSSIDSIIENKEINDYLKYVALQREIYLTQKKPDTFYKAYKAGNPDPNYFLNLEEALSKTARLDKDYVFKDMDGNDRYLSEFKDKIVYIDIWATWCGPCLQERKHFEALIDKFSDKTEDIVFMGISIDTDIRKWRSLVTVKDMKGVQFLSPQGFKSEICQDFGIGMIPRFMIVNKDGEFIEPNAMRPSQEEINDYLDRLIEEEKFSMIKN